MNPFRKTDKFSYLYHFSPFERDIIFDDSYLTANLTINYETGCTGKFSEKTHKSIQDHRNI